MKKIGTLTFHGVINHGAVLQAYALQRFIIKQGYQSELLNYQPWYFVWQVYRPAKGLSKSILKYSRLLKFNKFSKSHIYIGCNILRNHEDFKKVSGYSHVICGSDQIWNKKITNGDLDLGFFLKSTPADVKRIAYAASSGAMDISTENCALEELRKFFRVGLRELHLVESLSKRGISNLEMVLDPTLLLDSEDYQEVTYSELTLPEKFIASYEVSTDETRAKYNKLVNKLKKELSLPVVHIGDKAIDAADHNIINIAPNDWLHIMNRSSFVITNSFHGTAFSINFRKPFIMVSHIDEGRNARPLNLLKATGFEYCFLASEEEINQENLAYLLSDKDYCKFDSLVKSSRSFLIESLSCK